MQAREEYLPIRRPDPKDGSRVFRTFSVGKLADIWLTDTRSRRDEPVPEPAMLEPERSAWGHEQRDWLSKTIDESTATWRLLGNPSVMSPIWRPDFPEALVPALLKVKLIAEDGSGADFDQWDGYPVERDNFFKHILDKGIDNLVCLSGDVHISIATELFRDPFTSRDDPGVRRVRHAEHHVTEPRRQDGLAAPQRRRARPRSSPPKRCRTGSGSTSTATGTSSIDVTPERVTAEWWHFDTVLERTTKEELGASFSTEHGSRRLTRVS